MLDQRLTTPFQTKWLSKLLGFDYEISYTKGCDNKAADALSRMESYGNLFAILTSVTSDLMIQVEHSWTLDQATRDLISKLQADPQSNPRYTWQHNQFRRKGKVVVGMDLTLRIQLIKHFHCDPTGGHYGIMVTYKKLAVVFYWKGMKPMIKK